MTRLDDLWGTAEVKWSRLKVMWLGGVVCGQEEDIRQIITHSQFPITMLFIAFNEILQPSRSICVGLKNLDP